MLKQITTLLKRKSVRQTETNKSMYFTPERLYLFQCCYLNDDLFVSHL